MHWQSELQAGQLHPLMLLKRSHLLHSRELGGVNLGLDCEVYFCRKKLPTNIASMPEE
jgi:hypothetical protein